MKKVNVFSILHALVATLATITLLNVEIINQPFWLVVILTLSWVVWIPLMIRTKQWLLIFCGSVVVSPAVVVAVNLMLIAYPV